MISLNYAKTGIRQVRQYKEKERLLRKRLDSQLHNYCVQAEYIEKIRAFKHDYLNQIRGIGYLMEVGRIEDVRKYVTALNDELRSTEGRFEQFSNAPLIDAILRDTQCRCEKLGIQFKASLHLKKELCLTSLEQCIFFSDFLKLAVEAALSAEESNRCLWIENRFRDQWTVIKCTAFCGEKFSVEPCATEKMRNMTQTKGGFFDVRIEEGVFSLLCSWIEEDCSGTDEKASI